MSSASPKMERQYSAILACCFALWGPRSEVRGSWGEVEVPRLGQRSARSVEGSGVGGHRSGSTGHGKRLSLGLLGVPRSEASILQTAETDVLGQGPTHESTWFSKERMTG